MIRDLELLKSQKAGYYLFEAGTRYLPIPRRNYYKSGGFPRYPSPYTNNCIHTAVLLGLLDHALSAHSDNLLN